MGGGVGGRCGSRWAQRGGDVDGVVIGRRRVRQQHVPVGSLLVANRGEHLLGEYVVDQLDAAVGAGVVGAGVDLAEANAVVDDGRQLWGELLTIVGEERHRAPPERGVLVD